MDLFVKNGLDGFRLKRDEAYNLSYKRLSRAILWFRHILYVLVPSAVLFSIGTEGVLLLKDQGSPIESMIFWFIVICLSRFWIGLVFDDAPFEKKIFRKYSLKPVIEFIEEFKKSTIYKDIYIKYPEINDSLVERLKQSNDIIRKQIKEATRKNVERNSLTIKGIKDEIAGLEKKLSELNENSGKELLKEISPLKNNLQIIGEDLDVLAFNDDLQKFIV
ncbi:MAG: hypothetical protein NTY12_03345 [Candidatus Falkowbacteria bacterium]|nr:hypothetical protein [Candidatus Falkowbacteria bacterium]